MGYDIARQGFQEGNSRLREKRRAEAETPPGRGNVVGLGSVGGQQSCGKS